MTPIDLDQNATTPIDPAVLDAMRPYWLAGGNPESRHALGRASRRGMEWSREVVARVLGANPGEVIFTSGGTEANNLAVFGLAGSPSGAHLICSPVEHPAVSGPVARLEAQGACVTRPEVDGEGLADTEAFARAIRPETRLATLILANNETGAIQPVARLASLARGHGIAVHTDAVQAVGRIPVDFHPIGVSTLAASAHKFHGPAGVGLLLVREGVRLPPALFGGGQQRGIRPGTPPVALIVGLAAALERWEVDANRTAQWLALRDRLETGIVSALGAVRNGPSSDADRLPQTLNLGFPGVDGDALLMGLDLAGLAVSLGSACASGATTASPTLLAMRVPPDRLRSSVRFSLGAFTTEGEIDEAIARVVEVVARLTPLAPMA